MKEIFRKNEAEDVSLQPKRIYKLDNIKFILIVLVVFGHLCEQVSFAHDRFIYLFIYSFHMPAFAFISGYCSKHKTTAASIRKNIIFYIVFQFLYSAFLKYALHIEGITYQFTTPYWILWYFVALILWKAALLCCDDNEKCIRNLLLISVPVALLTGCDLTVGYYISLSRAVVMFPFFIGGYYLKIKGFLNKPYIHNRFLQLASLMFAFVMTFLLYQKRNILQWEWTYHSLPYMPNQSTVYTRIFFLLTAVAFIFFFCVSVPNIKIPIITYIGRNTLSVFVLHGFIIRYFAYKDVWQLVAKSALTTGLVSLLIVLLLSNKGVNFLFSISFEKIKTYFNKKININKRGLKKYRKNDL